MKKITYQGNYITTSEEEINGHVYERVSLRPGVHLLPIRDNKILLMNEFRTHERDSRWKLISGWCDKEGKTPVEHAIEELAEEVNMQAEHWQELFYTHVPGATVNPNTYYFVCTDISELDVNIENPDSGEVLGYDWFSFNEIFTLINEQKMWPDDSTMVAVAYLYNLNK